MTLHWLWYDWLHLCEKLAWELVCERISVNISNKEILFYKSRKILKKLSIVIYLNLPWIYEIHVGIYKYGNDSNSASKNCIQYSPNRVQMDSHSGSKLNIPDTVITCELDQSYVGANIISISYRESRVVHGTLHSPFISWPPLGPGGPSLPTLPPLVYGLIFLGLWTQEGKSWLINFLGWCGLQWW